MKSLREKQKTHTTHLLLIEPSSYFADNIAKIKLTLKEHWMLCVFDLTLSLSIINSYGGLIV